MRTFADWWGFEKERDGRGGAERRDAARAAWNAAIEAAAMKLTEAQATFRNGTLDLPGLVRNLKAEGNEGNHS